MKLVVGISGRRINGNGCRREDYVRILANTRVLISTPTHIENNSEVRVVVLKIVEVKTTRWAGE